MGGIIKFLVVAVAVVIGLFFSGVLFPEGEPPEPKDGWWGRGPRQPDTDTSIREFKVCIPDAGIRDLKLRLSNARYGEDLVDSIGFQYGFPVRYQGTNERLGFHCREIKEIADYWINEFDWRKQEAELNSFPQYKTTIEGIEIHFLRVKPKNGRKGKPLLISHGWPGSVWEFYKMIPMLTDPAAYGGRDEDAFEVIAPSIPGYGFSEAPHRTGFNAQTCAGVFVKLMERLGFKKFYAQGGDWGAAITTYLAIIYPQNVFGIHLNIVSLPNVNPRLNVHKLAASIFPSLFLNAEDQKLMRPFFAEFSFLLREIGYFHIQATKPNTAGIAINDSPMGMAAYILEKFGTWTNRAWIDLPDGGITKKFTLDELLTNIMIYWFSGNVASSQRFYKENFQPDQLGILEKVPVKVPVGLASSPEEILVAPRPFAEYKFKDIVQYSYLLRGGHFLAFEEPKLLAEDFFSFVRKLEERDKIKY